MVHELDPSLWSSIVQPVLLPLDLSQSMYDMLWISSRGRVRDTFHMQPVLW